MTPADLLREYLVVATRPVDVNGLGLSVRDATANVNEFLRRLHVYDKTEDVAREHRYDIDTFVARLHSRRRLEDAWARNPTSVQVSLIQAMGIVFRWASTA